MKLNAYLLTLLLIGFLLMAMKPQESGSEMIRLTQNDNGKELTVPLGAVIQIELSAAGGTGYLWQFDDLDREHFELLKTETVKDEKPGLIGAPTVMRWQVKTRQQGQADLKLYYFRPWEGKDKAADQFVIRVRIT
jgi:predicted secreted protein